MRPARSEQQLGSNFQLTSNRSKGFITMVKFSHEQAERLLGRLDRIAATIQDNAEKWGMPFKTAKEIVNALDKTADEIEVSSFGPESFTSRQAEVLEKEKDESYMTAFDNPQAPVQTESDEPYMSEFKTDQSSGLHHGKSTTGRPLAP